MHLWITRRTALTGEGMAPHATGRTLFLKPRTCCRSRDEQTIANLEANVLPYRIRSKEHQIQTQEVRIQKQEAKIQEHQ